MQCHAKRAESLLFDYETTGRTDFRDGEIKPILKTFYKAKPTRPRPPAKPLKDLHAMTEWRVANSIPFDLYHKPKEIIRTHPRHIQRVYTKPLDLEREQIQKTRPRVLITPALVMDDVTDPDARKDMVEDFYTTSTQRGLRSVKQIVSVKAPYVDYGAPAQPVTVRPMLPPFVSPQWRMDSAGWDRRQLRTAAHATKQFWLQRPRQPQKCGTFHFA